MPNELKPEDVMKLVAWYEAVSKNIGSVTVPYNELQAIAALLREKDAKIKSLRAENEEQDQAIIRALHSMGEIRRTARAEALTEFADRLKERMREVYPADIYDSDIDQIAYELKGENK